MADVFSPSSEMGDSRWLHSILFHQLIENDNTHEPTNHCIPVFVLREARAALDSETLSNWISIHQTNDLLQCSCIVSSYSCMSSESWSPGEEIYLFLQDNAGAKLGGRYKVSVL